MEMLSHRHNLLAEYCLFAVLLLVFIQVSVSVDDFYQLLKVSRGATTKEVRRAFKRAALELHPDKSEAQNAHANFMRLLKAYETLKDSERRHNYDVYGEQEDGRTSVSYHSWSYYRDDVAVYDDDDSHIVTLEETDFDEVVIKSHEIWFINFYSPACSHCHHLAPVWRELAKQLQHVVYFGAVNCADELSLCETEHVRSYPSLVLYPQRERFGGERVLDDLRQFVLERVHARVIDLNDDNAARLLAPAHAAAGGWLVFFCGAWPQQQQQRYVEGQPDDGCADVSTTILLSVMLRDVANVAQVECGDSPRLCRLLAHRRRAVYFSSTPTHETNNGAPVSGETIATHTDIQHAFAQLVPLLPQAPPPLSNVEAQLILAGVRACEPGCQDTLPSSTMAPASALSAEYLPYLVQVVSSGGQQHQYTADASERPQLLRLSALLHSTKWRRLLCPLAAMSADRRHDAVALLCGHFADNAPAVQYVYARLPRQLPTAAAAAAPVCDATLEAVDGVRGAAVVVAAFAREAANSRLHALLSSAAVAALVDDTAGCVNGSAGGGDASWLVQFHVAWCRPCRRLVRVMRRVSVQLRSPVAVGLVDCVRHESLCRRVGIVAYPSLILFRRRRRSSPEGAVSDDGDHYERHQYDGPPTSDAILQFVDDIVRPIVEPLNDSSLVSVILSEFGTGGRAILTRQDRVLVLNYGATWCGACHRLAPEYRRAARYLATHVHGMRFFTVDCGRDVVSCGVHNVTTYPTMRVYLPTSDQSFQLHWLSDLSGVHDWVFVCRWMLHQLRAPRVHVLSSATFEARVVRRPVRTRGWLVVFHVRATCDATCQRGLLSFHIAATRLLAAGYRLRYGSVECDGDWAQRSEGEGFSARSYSRHDAGHLCRDSVAATPLPTVRLFYDDDDLSSETPLLMSGAIDADLSEMEVDLAEAGQLTIRSHWDMVGASIKLTHDPLELAQHVYHSMVIVNFADIGRQAESSDSEVNLVRAEL